MPETANNAQLLQKERKKIEQLLKYGRRRVLTTKILAWIFFILAAVSAAFGVSTALAPNMPIFPPQQCPLILGISQALFYPCVILGLLFALVSAFLAQLNDLAAVRAHAVAVEVLLRKGSAE